MARVHTRWSLPQAVPRSTLSTTQIKNCSQSERQQIAMHAHVKHDGRHVRETLRPYNWATSRHRRQLSIMARHCRNNCWWQWVQRELTSTVVMYGCLRQHGIVLNLCLSNRRAVVADQNQLGCATRRVLAQWSTRVWQQICIGTQASWICHTPFPDRRVFRHVLEPRVNLPLFMTSAKRALILSWLFFCTWQQMLLFASHNSESTYVHLRLKPFCSLLQHTDFLAACGAIVVYL